MTGSEDKLPLHVGIIMDGNGRWAASRGLPRSMGHKQGASTFKKIARHARRVGIGHLSVYAFSTENWKRPAAEVNGIMSLLRAYLKDMEKEADKETRIRVLGDDSMLADDIRERIKVLEEKTKDRTGMCLNIALCYGGRAELVHAAKILAGQAATGAIKPGDITEDALSGALYTGGQPDVDLIIRTGGERRVSNFLLWQSAYAEYVFTDVLWPDFGPADFDAALGDFATRVRRMGGVMEGSD